jgi:NAD+ kinase
MSAGGPIVDPKAHILLMTPINAHDLNSQSIVLGAEAVIEIEMGSRRYQRDEQAGVSFDGDTHFHLQAGERVRIERASDAIRICRISNRSFLENLRKKMKQ